MDPNEQRRDYFQDQDLWGAEEGFEDPLYKLLDEIGEEKIEGDASTKVDFDQLTINLYLDVSISLFIHSLFLKLLIIYLQRTRLLEDLNGEDTIVKCNRCGSPVTKGMISDAKFREAVENIDYSVSEDEFKEDKPIKVSWII